LPSLSMGSLLSGVSASILGDLGRIIDKVFGICLIVFGIIAILVLAWILSHFFGGGGRG